MALGYLQRVVGFSGCPVARCAAPPVPRAVLAGSTRHRPILPNGLPLHSEQAGSYGPKSSGETGYRRVSPRPGGKFVVQVYHSIAGGGKKELVYYGAYGSSEEAAAVHDIVRDVLASEHGLPPGTRNFPPEGERTPEQRALFERVEAERGQEVRARVAASMGSQEASEKLAIPVACVTKGPRLPGRTSFRGVTAFRGEYKVQVYHRSAESDKKASINYGLCGALEEAAAMHDIVRDVLESEHGLTPGARNFPPEGQRTPQQRALFERVEAERGPELRVRAAANMGNQVALEASIKANAGRTSHRNPGGTGFFGVRAAASGKFTTMVYHQAQGRAFESQYGTYGSSEEAAAAHDLVRDVLVSEHGLPPGNRNFPPEGQRTPEQRALFERVEAERGLELRARAAANMGSQEALEARKNIAPGRRPPGRTSFRGVTAFRGVYRVQVPHRTAGSDKVTVSSYGTCGSVEEAAALHDIVRDVLASVHGLPAGARNFPPEGQRTPEQRALFERVEAERGEEVRARAAWRVRGGAGAAADGAS